MRLEAFSFFFRCTRPAKSEKRECQLVCPLDVGPTINFWLFCGPQQGAARPTVASRCGLSFNSVCFWCTAGILRPAGPLALAYPFSDIPSQRRSAPGRAGLGPGLGSRLINYRSPPPPRPRGHRQPLWARSLGSATDRGV